MTHSSHPDDDHPLPRVIIMLLISLLRCQNRMDGKIMNGEELCTDIRRLTTGIRYGKCVVRRFRRCANVYLYKPIAPRLHICTACYCTEYRRQL